MSVNRIEGAICIVDADVSVREALARLLSVGGFRVRTFVGIEQFVSEPEPLARGCLLVDSSLVGSAGASGERMRRRCLDWPVIVLAASADEPTRHEARAFGARFLLSKPVDAQALFDAIAWVSGEERRAPIE